MDARLAHASPTRGEVVAGAPASVSSCIGAAEPSSVDEHAPLHVAIALTGLAGGGSQRRMLVIAAELLARGQSVDIVVPSADGEFRDRVPAAARLFVCAGPLGRVVGIRRRKTLRSLAAVGALARYFEHRRPDVVLSSSTPANLWALAAREVAPLVVRDPSRATRERRRIPVVACVNVPLSRATRTARRPGVARLVRSLYRRADAVVTVCDALAHDTIAFTGVEPARVVAIPSPVAADEIRTLADAPAPHPWLARGQPPVVLGVGKLKEQKDFATLIRAFAEVRRARMARLLILGEGEQRAELLALASALGLERDAALPGFAPNPFAYMARAAVLAVTSRWEGLSNVALEALACGCPVVAADCDGGMDELLAHGRFGRLVPPGDARATARAIAETIDEPRDAAALQRRAAELPPARAAQRYLEVLRACARAQATDACATPTTEGWGWDRGTEHTASHRHASRYFSTA